MLILDLPTQLKVIKTGEKMIVQNIISKSMTYKANSNLQTTKEAALTESSSAKENLQNISKDLGRTVKGEFGNRVRDTFKNQTEKMDQFND